MKLSLEQRAISVCILANLGAGMVLALVLSPELFTGNMLIYFIILPMAMLLFVSVGIVNYYYLRYGLIEGFKKSGRGKQ